MLVCFIREKEGLCVRGCESLSAALPSCAAFFFPPCMGKSCISRRTMEVNQVHDYMESAGRSACLTVFWILTETWKQKALKKNAFLKATFSRTVRTCLLSFKEQTEVILTRPRSFGTQLSIPISFIGCPNSVSSFLEEEVRDRRNAKCSIQQGFLTDTVKVMHHKVLLIRLHYSSWIEKLSVLKGQCTRIMDRHIFTLSLEFAVYNVALKAPCSRGKKRKDRYDTAD